LDRYGVGATFSFRTFYQFRNSLKVILKILSDVL
jgi:hypothetical protein